MIVLGLNHLTSNVAERERWGVPSAQTSSFVRGLLQIPSVQGVVTISTCNRVEIYVSAEEGFNPASLKTFWACFLNRDPADFPSSYVFSGREAFVHLLRVASGLNSLALGETEILGQVKLAYQNALEWKSSDVRLNFVFQQAFRFAKKIRTETGITKCPTSIGTVALQLAEQVFGPLKDQTALVVGLGEIGTQTASLLLKRGIGRLAVANRTHRLARNFAEANGATAHPFDRLEEMLSPADLVITATASEEPILSREMIGRFSASRGKRPLVLIDLGVPRDIDPSAGDLSGVYLYNMDDLKTIAEKNMAFRKKEKETAEAMIGEASALVEGEWEKKLIHIMLRALA